MLPRYSPSHDRAAHVEFLQAQFGILTAHGLEEGVVTIKVDTFAIVLVGLSYCTAVCMTSQIAKGLQPLGLQDGPPLGV